MAGRAHNVMRLLLFSFICVNGKDGPIFPERGYDIMFPCEEDLVCFHLWHPGARISDYIAVVINGEILTAKSKDNDKMSKCALEIREAEDVRRHGCQKRSGVFSPNNTDSAMPDFKLMPGKRMSMHCILLTYADQKRCKTEQQQRVRLMWVDEAGSEIQEDSQHQIKQRSSCSKTLTVSFQSPGRKKFRCKAIVDSRDQTSVELGVRVLALKGRGRGSIINLQPEDSKQVGKRSMIGITVGVVGCVVLTTLVAAFAGRRRRRRMSNQQPGESHTNNNVTSEDDVVYTDLILPVGSSQAWVHDSTEYACVKYK